MTKRIKKTLAFTLVELIAIVGIISLLIAIVIVMINPLTLFGNARNGVRSTDLSAMKVAFNRYINQDPSTGFTQTLNDFPGFSQLYWNATTNVSGKCPNGSSSISSPVTGAFTISTTTSNTSIDITKLINKGYITKLPTDPQSAQNYKACIDTSNGNQFVIYADILDYTSTFALASILVTPGSILDPGLVLYLSFDEGSGTVANDKSNKTNNATWSGTGTHWGTGKYGSAAIFNGTDDYLSTNLSTIGSLANATLEFWINKSRNNVYEIPVEGLANSSPSFESTDPLTLYVNNNCNLNLSSFNTSKWYYVTATWDGINAKVYVNGIYYSSVACTAQPTPGAFTLGGRSGSFSFLGSIDSFRIYNYARTATQILTDMNTP